MKSKWHDINLPPQATELGSLPLYSKEIGAKIPKYQLQIPQALELSTEPWKKEIKTFKV